MSDVMTGTEQIKAVVQGLSAWMPVISTLAGGVLAGGVALLVSKVNHSYAREREATATAERLRHEQQLTEDKRQRELFYIATELIFLLEQYAEGCANVATDDGEDDDSSQPVKKAVVNYPVLNLRSVSGDWRVLKAPVMYRIRQLPVLQDGALRRINGVEEYDHPPGYTQTFRERQYQFARLGLKAVILAMRLRKSQGLPETRLRDTQWSAYNVLWKKWREESKRRIVQKWLESQQLATFEIINSQRKALPGAELTESREP